MISNFLLFLLFENHRSLLFRFTFNNWDLWFMIKNGLLLSDWWNCPRYFLKCHIPLIFFDLFLELLPILLRGFFSKWSVNFHALFIIKLLRLLRNILRSLFLYEFSQELISIRLFRLLNRFLYQRNIINLVWDIALPWFIEGWYLVLLIRR